MPVSGSGSEGWIGKMLCAAKQLMLTPMDDLHPNVNGQDKVAGMLMNFFLTSPYTPWFKAKP
jgi:hypothetical protein